MMWKQDELISKGEVLFNCFQNARGAEDVREHHKMIQSRQHDSVVWLEASRKKL